MLLRIGDDTLDALVESTGVDIFYEHDALVGEFGDDGVERRVIYARPPTALLMRKVYPTPGVQERSVVRNDWRELSRLMSTITRV